MTAEHLKVWQDWLDESREQLSKLVNVENETETKVLKRVLADISLSIFDATKLTTTDNVLNVLRVLLAQLEKEQELTKLTGGKPSLVDALLGPDEEKDSEAPMRLM